jgi:ArsR family transcriptional regulator
MALALDGRELCVCQLVELLGLSFPTVSRHLSIMEAAGLIEAERRGKWIYCRQARRGGDKTALAALKWLRNAAAANGSLEDVGKRMRELMECPPAFAPKHKIKNGGRRK